MSLTFFLYARKSSQGESKQVESIPDQLNVLRTVRDTSHLTIAFEFTESRSAMKPDTRPVFRNMLDRIQAGEANAILCWHVNRLYRNSKEYGEVAHMLETGVIQCIKTPEREYHPEDHGLLMAVEASMATQYVKDLKRDATRGVTEKADKGWYPFKPKAGYIVDPFTKEVVPDPVSFPLLRTALELMLSGGYSVEEVRSELNRSGYRTPRTKSGGAKPMSRSSMYRFLTDRFYQGEFEFKGVWTDGRHRPMLTREEFARIQRMLKRPLKAQPQKHRFPYTGLMRCGTCGCQITAETHVKHYPTTGLTRSYSYYHCTGRRGCKQRSIAADDLEEQVLAKIEHARLDPAFLDWAIAEVQRDETDQRSTVDQMTPAQASSRRTITMKLDSLWEMRHAREITPDEFRERKALYETEIRKLQDEAYRIASKVERDRGSLLKALTFSRDAYARFTNGNVQEKRQVAMELGHAYVLTLESLEIRSHPVIEQFLTFEPKSHQPQQIGTGGSGSNNPDWRAMLDAIRTVISRSELPFPIENTGS